MARFDLERSLERGVRGLWPGSAAFPKYGRNLNMGGDNNRDSTYATAHQRILHDRARPSFVTMPVIPR
ncbi:MAG: hypothetical protein HY705_09305 [Gemmatimonadetes bacterium]|nr:hypothetical protein [Gemmatimonadota bacterium]